MVVHKGMFIQKGRRTTSGLRLSTYICAHNLALIEHLHALHESIHAATRIEWKNANARSQRRGRQADKFLMMSLILATANE